MGLSSAGIGSGLDVNNIVQQLMASEQKPLTALNNKQSEQKSRLTAYGSISSALSNFQSTLKKLSDPLKIQAITATTSDNSSLTALGQAGATPGSYAIQVHQLATAQKLVSTGQSSAQNIIGKGTLQFEFGTITGGTLQQGIYAGANFVSSGKTTQTVSIGEGQNTLQGIRDAINAAAIGVTATIVNDGSSTPYRLALSNSQTGESSSMKILVNGDAGLQALLAYDPVNPQGQAMSQTAKAQNAVLSVDGINVSKSSNTVRDVLSGVTLELNKVSNSPVQVTVTQDNATVQANIKEFVDGYNKLSSTLKNLSNYDPVAKKASALTGDTTLKNLQNQVRSIVTGQISGNNALTRLNHVGIEIQKDGMLTLNNAKLESVLKNQFELLPKLFSESGQSSDSQISFIGTTAKTRPGNYPITITQLATQSSLSGQTLSNSITIDNNNDNLEISLDGTVANLKVSHGIYSPEQLASQLQAQINGHTTFQAQQSSVTSIFQNGQLHLTSNRYGPESQIGIRSSAAIALLSDGLSANEWRQASPGKSLQGSIQGVNAQSSGQFLTGALDQQSEGLKIRVQGSTLGVRGDVQFTQGFAAQLDRLINTFLGDNGFIASRTEGINSVLKKMDSEKLRLQDRLGKLQSQYQAQYAKLDMTMSSMNNTASTLTQQLANLAKQI